jgi:hypothetical protein
MNVEGPLQIPTGRPDWSLISHHGIVLFLLARMPNATLKRLSFLTGFTERTLYAIVKDLAGANMVIVIRVGRTKSYALNRDAHFVHPLFSHVRIGTMLEVFERRG